LLQKSRIPPTPVGAPQDGQPSAALTGPLLFADFELDPSRRDLRRGSETIHVEPQVFDLLLHLVTNRHRVVGKDELMQVVWGGRIVSEDALTSRLSSARRALADTGRRQQFIRTVPRRGFRFVAEVRTALAHEPNGEGIVDPSAGVPQDSPGLQQEVTFCRAFDGVNLALSSVGRGVPLVKTANWLNHIEFDWQSPVWSPLFTRLASRFRLVRYDERGMGLSDRDEAVELSFEAWVRDLEAVVDALGLDRFALLGISQGAPISIAYAVRHPKRVSRLVLCGGFAKGWAKRGSDADAARAEASITLIREGWGRDNPAARQMFTSLIVPDATLEEMRWFNDLERVSASPETAIRMLKVIGDIDISNLLDQVRAPTLVLHSRGDARVPFEHGLKLARAIPNARFVTLESNNHLILSHEPAWPRYVNEISSFVAAPGGPK
jgi:pimeloyl-ACP methyl ester carboxylesterase/DNA-binding winged helix-turn-helix (wHTH) protein